MKTYDLTVGAAQSGMRLDVYLVAAELGLSRRKIRQVIDVGGVYVNRKRVRIASRQVCRGDKIRVEYSESSLKTIRAAEPQLAAEALLYEAHGVVAINKPPGLPSQATKDQSVMHVVPSLEALFKSLGRPKTPFTLVHRLDKETSGVILVATSAARATWLTDQFRERAVRKTYLALCYGVAKSKSFTERAFLTEIDKRSGDVKVVRAGGRTAVTHFRVLSENKELGISLVACHPETGRSHQIRVHLQLNGLPIIGDKRYSGPSKRPLPAQLAELSSLHHFLHAYSLQFAPTAGSKPVLVNASMPPRFINFINASGLLFDASQV
ncbi:MAG: RluA family pseudouridine synthase [Deltaproteobacteria bacterium]|nr:RluA family pseudouridine synthase [Deltaproteobacteria bacterium]